MKDFGIISGPTAPKVTAIMSITSCHMEAHSQRSGLRSHRSTELRSESRRGLHD